MSMLYSDKTYIIRDCRGEVIETTISEEDAYWVVKDLIENQDHNAEDLFVDVVATLDSYNSAKFLSDLGYLEEI